MGGGGLGGGGPATTKLVIGIAVVSILATAFARFGGGAIFSYLLFTPALTLEATFLWQPLTYAFVYPISGGFGVFGFLISLYFLYSIGSQVESVLGARRFLGFYLASAVLGALLTIPVAYLFGFEGVTHAGMWVALGAVTILFAHNFRGQPILLMFVLPVQGKQLIIVSFAVLALYALAEGPASVVPNFFAMLAALAFAYGVFRPKRAWLRFRAWRIERELRRRSRHLSVIRGGEEEEGAPPPGRDKGGSGPWLH